MNADKASFTTVVYAFFCHTEVGVVNFMTIKLLYRFAVHIASLFPTPAHLGKL